FDRMVDRLQASFSQMQQLNQDLTESESRLRQLLEALPVGTAVHDATGTLIYLNRVGRKILDVDQTSETPADQLSTTFQSYKAETQEPYPRSEIPAIRALAGESVYAENMELRRENQVVPIEIWASPIYDDRGQVTYAIAAFQDISDRKRTEEQLVYNALHDSLTDLPNRALLVQRLNLAISRAQRSPAFQFAVLFLDLDRFKVFNDSLGHLLGDQILIATARKLQQVIEPTDLAARLGGDEFMLLLEAIEDSQVAIDTAAAILAELASPITVEERELVISTSIGVVIGSAAYHDASDLIRDADIALYRAKAKGKNRYEVFDAEMYTQALKRMQLENDLRQAIARQELEVYYQPIFSVEGSALTSFEALVRWPHPTQGMISPVDFIEVAEETGLIAAIDGWVIQRACQQMADWHRQFPHQRHLKVCVNVSSREIQENHLVNTVIAALNQTGLPPDCLTLEITENILIENIEYTTALLHTLRNQGIRISIDDFGTGYSSLSYLYNLPADSLKIDKSFVSRMDRGNKNFKIVEAVIALSNQLQIDAIAEGIETQEQLDLLRAMGCELGQGYLISRPLPPAAAAQLLSRELT
ncbi:diguanylate cyclase, partial [filamentous cyanobacterium CCP5]